jgi:aryl-alcohol dehydrogenase-like predicted oxidoreductase
VLFRSSKCCVIISQDTPTQ